jgi:hypothetical protein
VGQLGLVDAEEDRAGLDEHRDRPAFGEAKALGGGPGDPATISWPATSTVTSAITAPSSTLRTVPLSWLRALSLTISSLGH